MQHGYGQPKAAKYIMDCLDERFWLFRLIRVGNLCEQMCQLMVMVLIVVGHICRKLLSTSDHVTLMSTLVLIFNCIRNDNERR